MWAELLRAGPVVHEEAALRVGLPPLGACLLLFVRGVGEGR